MLAKSCFDILKFFRPPFDTSEVVIGCICVRYFEPKRLTKALSLLSDSVSTYRPKTADFYRKKQPENELAIFWSRKIRSVIEKWDQEDKEEDFIQSDTVTDTVSCKTRTTQCNKNLQFLVDTEFLEFHLKHFPRSP
jgi:hypothetical protein